MTVACEAIEICPDCKEVNYVSVLVSPIKGLDTGVRFKYKCKKCKKEHEASKFELKG